MFQGSELHRRVCLALDEALGGGLTQPELAEQLGFKDERNIRHYKKGRHGPPHEVVVKLAGLVGKPVAWFYETESENGLVDSKPGPSERVSVPRSSRNSSQEELLGQLVAGQELLLAELRGLRAELQDVKRAVSHRGKSRTPGLEKAQ